jgi:hypothetical protein
LRPTLVQYKACKAVQLADIEAEVTQAKLQAKAKQQVWKRGPLSARRIRVAQA